MMRRTTLLVALLLLGACGSTDRDRGITGGAIGAGTGALAGAATGGSAVGGAILGGAAGAAIGVFTDRDDLDLGDPFYKDDQG